MGTIIAAAWGLLPHGQHQAAAWPSRAPVRRHQGLAGEDDGYLITYVHDTSAVGEQGSELVIYSAKTMSPQPVARCASILAPEGPSRTGACPWPVKGIGHDVPACCHGIRRCWLSLSPDAHLSVGGRSPRLSFGEQGAMRWQVVPEALCMSCTHQVQHVLATRPAGRAGAAYMSVVATIFAYLVDDKPPEQAAILQGASAAARALRLPLRACAGAPVQAAG